MQYTTSIVKNSDKEKMVWNSGYGISFDSAGSQNFDNVFAKNVVIFGADNSLPFDTDDRMDNFLVLGECPAYGFNGSFGSPEKKLCINFSKANTKFFLSLHYNGDNIYLFFNVYLMDKNDIKLFTLIKQVLIVLLCFRKHLTTKCMSLINEPV